MACLDDNQSQGRVVLRRHTLTTVTLAVLSFSCIAGAKDIALIANKSNHLVDVSAIELAKICRGQTNRWPDGKPVSFVTRDPASAEMRLVLEKVYSLPKEEVLTLISNANHARVNH